MIVPGLDRLDGTAVNGDLLHTDELWRLHTDEIMVRFKTQNDAQASFLDFCKGFARGEKTTSAMRQALWEPKPRSENVVSAPTPPFRLECDTGFFTRLANYKLQSGLTEMRVRLGEVSFQFPEQFSLCVLNSVENCTLLLHPEVIKGPFQLEVECVNIVGASIEIQFKPHARIAALQRLLKSRCEDGVVRCHVARVREGVVPEWTPTEVLEKLRGLVDGHFVSVRSFSLVNTQEQVVKFWSLVEEEEKEEKNGSDGLWYRALISTVKDSGAVVLLSAGAVVAVTLSYWWKKNWGE